MSYWNISMPTRVAKRESWFWNTRLEIHYRLLQVGVSSFYDTPGYTGLTQIILYNTFSEAFGGSTQVF